MHRPGLRRDGPLRNSQTAEVRQEVGSRPGAGGRLATFRQNSVRREPVRATNCCPEKGSSFTLHAAVKPI